VLKIIRQCDICDRILDENESSDELTVSVRVLEKDVTFLALTCMPCRVIYKHDLMVRKEEARRSKLQEEDNK